MFGVRSATAPLERALLYGPAAGDSAAARWRAEPALDRLRRDHAAFAELLASLGVDVMVLPARDGDVDAPDELDAQGCNVLAVRPGVVVAADTCPRARRILERAGCEAHTYPARELNKGESGRACLALPVRRAATA